jgi:hypothetical protein
MIMKKTVSKKERKTKMSFKEFVKKYENKTVDFDGSYGGQCVDLFNQYIKEIWGINEPIKEFPVASAYQLYDMATKKSNFVCQLNGPNDVPQEGDVIIWTQGVGPHGHVGLYVSGDVMNLKVFEQNWNNVQKCVINDHKYNNIKGWFRLKK